MAMNDKNERKPSGPKMGICDKCKEEKMVRSFRSRETTMSNGAASYGTVIKHYCEDCAPKSRAQRDAEAAPKLDPKQLKSLMRAAKKGLL